VADEYYIADDLCRALDGCGAEIVGSVPNLAKALTLAASESLICAVLDINLRGDSDLEVAETLHRHNVPFIHSSGYNASTVPETLGGTVHLEKPFRSEDLLRAAHEVARR